jgi:hypothetical protein
MVMHCRTNLASSEASRQLLCSAEIVKKLGSSVNV